MKKIAIVVNNSWYAWIMRANLGFAFQKEGYEVVFICPYDKYSENIKKHFGYIDININSKGINPIEDLKTIYSYYKIYKELKPDIVLQYNIKPNIYGTIAADMLNIPTINNIAGLGTLFIKQNIITKIAKLLYKVSQKKATKVFFQNHDDFEMFVNEKLIQKEKCDVLPGSGVDITKFTPVEKNDDGVFRFLLASRMLWAKGIQEFVDAAKIIKVKYKNVEFQLLGHLDLSSPTAISKEQMHIWENDGYVKYLGSSDDIRVEIAQADCMVLPSFYREGTPRSILEAMSTGRAIITTDTPGCRETVVNGKNGYLIAPKSVPDLVNSMFKFVKNPNIISDMGIKSREIAEEKYDVKKVNLKMLRTMKIVK